MFYTFNILAERIIRDLSNGPISSDSPYDPEYIKLKIRDAMQESLKMEILGKRTGQTDDKEPPTSCIFTYTLDVLIESATHRVYIELPSYFVSLKYNKGIHSVAPVKKSLHAMIRVQNPTVSSHLPHADLERANYGYYVEGLKVFWMRDIIKDDITRVLVKLVSAAPSNFGDDDVLPLIPENIGTIEDIVKARVQNKGVQDRIADGNPNIRAINEQPRP